MQADAAAPTFANLLRVFTRIGFLSFGGPAGQIALMQHELVDERQWVEQGAFLRALNLCHLLPGPEAQQLATWIGWRLHGVKGGLAAGLLFVIPGAAVMLGLSLLYVVAAGLGWFAALFLGIKAAVLGIVVQALIRVGKRALGTPFKLALALLAFLALALLDAPFPLVILVAALAGALAGAVRPDWLGAHVARRARRRPAEQTAAGGRHAGDRRGVARNLACPDGADRRDAGHPSCTMGYRRVLFEAGGGDFRGSLRSARLYGPGGGRAVPLAERGRDGRRPRPCRNRPPGR